jgi:hypothetical protein
MAGSAYADPNAPAKARNFFWNRMEPIIVFAVGFAGLIKAGSIFSRRNLGA